MSTHDSNRYTVDAFQCGSETLLRVHTKQSVVEENVVLVLVLDVSHSMNDHNALQKLKDHLINRFLPSLPEHVGLALVTFAENAKTIFSYDTMHAYNRNQATSLISGIYSDNFTNITAGFEMAASVSLQFIGKDVRWIVLTDGEPNAGKYKMMLGHGCQFGRSGPWETPETAMKLAACTANYPTTLFLYTSGSSAELGEHIKKVRRDNSVKVSRTVDEMPEMFSSCAKELTSSNAALHISVGDASTVLDSAIVFDTTIESLKEQDYFLVNGVKDPVVSIVRGGDVLFIDTPSVVDVKTMTDEQEIRIVENHMKQQRAFNSISGRCEKLKAEIVAVAQKNDVASDDWVNVTLKKIDEVKKEIDHNTLEDGEFQEAFGALNVTYRSLGNNVAALKDIVDTLAPAMEIESPVLEDVPELPYATDADFLDFVDEMADASCYRSLSAGPAFTPEFQTVVASAETAREIVAKRNLHVQTQWNEKHKDILKANQARKDKKEFLKHMIVALA